MLQRGVVQGAGRQSMNIPVPGNEMMNDTPPRRPAERKSLTLRFLARLPPMRTAPSVP